MHNHSLGSGQSIQASVHPIHHPHNDGGLTQSWHIFQYQHILKPEKVHTLIQAHECITDIYEHCFSASLGYLNSETEELKRQRHVGKSNKIK
jgi:hypothetical protein